MTEFLPPDYAELRPTPFAGCELWHGLDTIIHNQHVLYHMLVRLLGRTSEIMTDLSPIANAVSAEQDAEQSVITLLKQLADEVRANAGDPAAVQQLADQIQANANALAQAVTANTPAAPGSNPPPSSVPASSPPTGGGPATSGTVDLSGSGSSGVPTPSDPAASGAATTADVSTRSESGQASPSTPSLPLYQHVGAGPVDVAAWPLADLQDDFGAPLYHYAGDSPGGAPTGASADWQVYTGPTGGQVSGSSGTSSSGAPHTPIDTTGV